MNAKLKSRELLTAGCPEKDTQHIVLDIEGTGITYEPGDCVAILPTNRKEDVEKLLKEFSNAPVTDREGNTHTLEHFLTHHANLSRYKPGMPPEKLPPLLPRFYSIASSMEAVGNEIHLTIRQLDNGICSHFLCEKANIGDEIPLYIHKAKDFKLPPHDTSMIMIGPGTGIAPYRGFMQERHAQKASGKNWLFFGEWTKKHHFFYEEYWNKLAHEGLLHLDLAFSRDQEEKVYVQHRMWEKRKDLWNWIQEGATLYVCGDAKQMAKAVDQTLQQIAQEVGGLTQDEAKAHFRTLRKEGRYLRDVY